MSTSHAACPTSALLLVLSEIRCQNQSDPSKAALSIFHLTRKGHFLQLYKYKKVAKPKLCFENTILLHDHSSWELRDIIGRKNSVRK
jgi:hypothetical protein